jgi:hypothetical protein
MFHQGVLLLDEVDSLLDPLRSELNWPLGQRVPLDLAGGHEASTSDSVRSELFQGIRYTLPFHLLDAVFVAATGCAETVNCAGRNEAQAALGALTEKMREGRRDMKLQTAPHLVLLSRDFYVKEMLPHLADWASLYLEERLQGALSDQDLRSYLRKPGTTALREMPVFASKLINLAVSWIHSLLPYMLSKVHRVAYGLLDGSGLEAAGERASARRRVLKLRHSRQLLAVPFVGKDTPSVSSEFSHPDVLIGFTIMAYRLGGLRHADVHTLLGVLVDDMKLSSSVPYHRREACRAYVQIVCRAGGRVRGFTQDGRWVADLCEVEQRQRRHAASLMPSLDGSDCMEEERRRVPPLELLELADPEQTGVIFRLMRHSPLAIQYLLTRHSFLVGTLDHHEHQIIASGQELAGPQLFGLCLGFSGTPNDLLPRKMGNCQYASGDDGRMLDALSNEGTVSMYELGAWTPQGLLDLVATARSHDGRTTKYHALIDTGALVTGMGNYDVAEYLLRHGLRGMDGVLFLNEKDERVVLERDGYKVVELAQCGLAPERRFTFYDHVHTTGMDVKQPVVCTACLTLSKDMVFRDYAQGAYRMRGIGRGQGIELFVTREVMALVQKAACAVEGVTEAARAQRVLGLRRKPSVWNQCAIVDIIVWLVLNGIRAEERKHQLLCHQDLRNLWRSAASTCLGTIPEDLNSWLQDARTQAAMELLRGRADFLVPTAGARLPGDAHMAKMRQDVDVHFAGEIPIWPNEEIRVKSQMDAQVILSALAPQQGLSRGELSRRGAVGEDADFGQFDLGFDGEQVREQEQNVEQDREEEQEHEVEVEEEAVATHQGATERNYAREDEAERPWPLEYLWAVPGNVRSAPFYPMAEFAVNKGVLNQSCNPLEGLTSSLLLSDNLYRRTWRLSSVRRLRNVICFLEWVPDVAKLKRSKADVLPPDARNCLREAFEIYGQAGTGVIDGQEAQMLFQALDLASEGQTLVPHLLASGLPLTLPKIEEEIAAQVSRQIQSGRYFVALSLQEAEHLRASMHRLRPEVLPPGCGIALRCLGNKEVCLDDSLLEAYGPVLEIDDLPYQLQAAEQLLRFINSAGDFQPFELRVLHRALQPTKLADRLPWWLDVRSCRRRPQGRWQQLPAASVFTKADEFGSLPTKALLSRVRWALAARRLSPEEAFTLMAGTKSSTLQSAKFREGLERLGICPTGGASAGCFAEAVDTLFKQLGQVGKGLGLDQFRSVMDLGSADWEAVGGLATSSVCTTRTMAASMSGEKKGDATRAKMLVGRPSLYDAAYGAGCAPSPLARLTPEMCKQLPLGRFKLKWQRHAKFLPLWTSAGTPNERPLSIWAANQLVPTGRLHGLRKGSNAVKERIAVGHYACAFFGAPPDAFLLEVTDVEESGVFAGHARVPLTRFLNTFFPHPVRFRQVWRRHSKEASDSLCIWEPIPPASAFVALGMVATAGDDAPSLRQVRCVPRPWAERVADANAGRLLWTGGGGDAGQAHFWDLGAASSQQSFSAPFRATVGPEAQLSVCHVMTPKPGKFYASLPPGM